MPLVESKSAGYPKEKSVTEEEQIEKLVASLALPREVSSALCLFDLDSTGAPCVHVKLLLAQGVRSSAATIVKLGGFKRSVSRAILDSGATRWPHVRLVTS